MPKSRETPDPIFNDDRTVKELAEAWQKRPKNPREAKTGDFDRLTLIRAMLFNRLSAPESIRSGKVKKEK